MLKVLAAMALLGCLCCAPSGWAQADGGASSTPSAGSDSKSQTPPHVDGPEKGSNEWLVWAGGAFPTDPFYAAPQARLWTAGGTYGRVLTDPHGPGFLRGRFEWAFEIDPIIEVLLPKRPVYAGGFAPVVWKWNLLTRRRLSPYLELYGGVLWGNHQVVAETTPFNFMGSTAGGLSFPLGKSGKYSWTVDVRWFHISNGGLTYYNPGINTIEFRTGFGFFSHPKGH